MNEFWRTFPDWAKCLTAIISLFGAGVSLWKSFKSGKKIKEIQDRLHVSDKISFFKKVSDDGKDASKLLYAIKNEETSKRDFKPVFEFTSFICANLSYFQKSNDIETKKKWESTHSEKIKNQAEDIRFYCEANRIDDAVKLIDSIVCEANAYIQSHKINNVIN